MDRNCPVPVRILVVDDHELIRKNISRLLSKDAEFVVVSEAATGPEAIREAQVHQPDVILLDISLPEINGIAALPMIKAVAPDARVLMVTNHEEPAFLHQAFAAGAHGFLTKSDLPSQLALAVEKVSRNETFVCKTLNRKKENALPGVPSVGSVEA
jgi:DNA-binding NarL/FixJ family response regulator